MAQTDIKINGFKELGKFFDELPNDIRKKTGIAALRKGAKPMLEEAKRKVPVKTGELRNSLEVKTKRTARIPVVKVQASKRKGGYHAHLVEYGTAAHDIRNVLIGNVFYPVIHHPGTSPQPFMRPAFLQKKDETLKIVLESITTEAVKKLKRA